MLLVFVQVLNSFVMLVVTCGVFAVVFMVMNVTTSLMLFQMMNHVLVLMVMRSVTVRMNRSVFMRHDFHLISCDASWLCRHASDQWCCRAFFLARRECDLFAG